jgi:predicted PurR-regulated permease PerM
MDGDREARARLWFYRVWITIGTLLLAWAFVHVFATPLRLLAPAIIFAWILIYLMNPIVTWLHRLHVHRLVGTALAYLVVAGLVTAGTALVFPLLAAQVADLADRMPAIASQLQDVVNGVLAQLGVTARISLDPAAVETQEAIQRFFEDNQEQLLGLLRGAGSLVAGVLAGLLALILGPVLAFYALVDLPRIQEGLRRVLPPTSRSEVIDVGQRILGTVGDYVRGQVLISLFVAVATSFGLWAIGLPFWALIGVIAGIFNLIPFVGPFVGALLAALVALIEGGGLPQAVIAVAVMTVIQQAESNIVTPAVLSRTVRVHPLTIILTLLIAGSLFGILGMLVVIPVIAALKLLVVYVLVTRVPSMAHLAGEGPEIIDGVPVEPRDTRIIAMGRELREARDRRRRAAAAAAKNTDDR